MATPSAKETLRIQKTFTNLDDFSDMTLVKTGDFTPAANSQEALGRVGNDQVKFLELVNAGLRDLAQTQLRESAGGWMEEDEEGNTTEVSGTPADPAKVNALVLTLAKTVFGYSKDMNKEQKKAAKDNAMSMIKTTDAIKDGLKKSAALK